MIRPYGRHGSQGGIILHHRGFGPTGRWALAFADAQEPSSDGVSMAFVAVYPLTMVFRVFAAQILILFFSKAGKAKLGAQLIGDC